MADSQKKLIILPDNPLCGISTYKDTLNLATGVCTRQIKKLVFDGSETWYINIAGTVNAFFSMILANPLNVNLGISTHFIFKGVYTSNDDVGFYITTTGELRIRPDNVSSMTKSDFTTWLSQQYANSTPVTVWYVLATPTTETITVPTGLSGTEEGYLIQDGTPTPTNPIYPTANIVEIWQHSLRKLTTATEAVENPLYSDGTAITSYTIKGNTVQNGTPTPSNPVEVNGVGVRTENLWNEDYTGISDTITYKPVYVGDGQFTMSNSAPRTSDLAALLFLLAGNVSSGASSSMNGVWDKQSRTVTSIGGYVTVAYRTVRTYTPVGSQTMLNTGSTAKPYEPYGYKIPISSGGVTTNIYLGSTQTVRQIKKIVLDGTEEWTAHSTYSGLFTLNVSDYLFEEKKIGLCTHYQFRTNTGASLISNNQAAFYHGTASARILYIHDDIYTTAQDFKAYLSQQYANGTPVTVWYVLATPETAAVNEPLMKIGDYADTLSNAAQIPTTEGANSITVDTTVQPSEFTATWTGWHDSSVKEWDGSQWNE